MELNSDLIVNGGAGFIAGGVSGYLLKKISGLLFKFAMVIMSFFVVALLYLQSIKVININERALDNLVNATYQKINTTIGSEAIVNPAEYIFTNLGIPMTSGIAIGFIAGWMKA